MDKDYIKSLGYRALDSRLKRISDRITHDIRKLYKEMALDIEPGWYLLLRLLKENEQLTIVQIAEQLSYAHPTVVVIIKKMVAKGYVVTERDTEDQRKRLISMTEKAKEALPRMEKIWQSCDRAILQVLEEDETILKYLDIIDEALKTSSFYERFKNELDDKD